MKRRIPVIWTSSILFVLAFSSVLFAQSGEIEGFVLDSQTADALPGANVYIEGTSLGAATDLNGKYVIPSVPPGTYKLIINYVGYSENIVDVTVEGGETVKVNITMDYQAIEGETIVVTAQAEGQMQAINQQLASNKIVNVVSEARMQELPDFNAAQALSRLPGISTQKSSGEDNKVVIRGLSPKYNQIAVEGVELSSTGSAQIGLTSDDFTYTPGVSNDRSVDLTMISPYMIKMMSVYKSLTPDMMANSIGGRVNMELREAPSGINYDLLYQQGYTAKSGTWGNYRIVGSGSMRFFEDKLGVYALVNAESYDRNADNLDAAYDIAAEAVQIDPTTGFRPVEVNDVTFNRHLETRERVGGNVILDYMLPDGSLKFVNMIARINSDYTRHRQTIDYDAGRMNWQVRVGENIIDQQMHSLQFDYDLGLLTADLSASYTSSSNLLDKAPVINFNQTDALQSGVPRDNVVPQDLTYLLTEFKGDSAVVLRSGNLFTNDYQEERWNYKADFQLPFNIGTKVGGFFKFGGQIYNQSNTTDQEAPYLGFSGDATGDGDDIQSSMVRAVWEQFGIATNEMGEFVGTDFLHPDQELFEPFLGDEYGDIYYLSDPDKLVEILNYIIGNPEFDASNEDVSSGSQGGWYDGPYQQLTNDYKYEEDYYAGYGMAQINYMNFMLIGGVRYEKVNSEFFAYNARDMRNAQAQIMYDTTSVRDNDFVLPMVQAKWAPLDWLDIRYAYTQTLSRPNYEQLSPKFTITQNNSIYTGNPDLEPALAINHDLNFTFHSNKIGLFTVGGFYKSIENFVYTANYQLDAAELAGVDSTRRYQVIRDGDPVVTPVINPISGMSNANVYRPLNNPFDATIKGIELDFQHRFWYLPTPLNNFVFGLNYARIWSEAEYPFYDVDVIIEGRDRIPVLVDSSSSGRLIDQPDHVLNGYLGYDYKGFSARLSVVYQDNSARVNGGRYPENDAYTVDYFRVDFSARQKLPFWNSELFLDASNLNDEYNSWVQKSTRGFRGIENYGLVVSFGLRIRS